MDFHTAALRNAGIYPGPADQPAAQSRAGNAPGPAAAIAGLESGLFGADGFDFFDLIDIINPLQHIPIISTIYRRATGDELAAAPRIAGGALFGGFIGLGTSVVNALIELNTGKDVGEHVAAAIFGDPDSQTPPGVMVAELPARDAPWYMAGALSHSPMAARQLAPIAIAEAATATDATATAAGGGAAAGQTPPLGTAGAAGTSVTPATPVTPVEGLPWLKPGQTAAAAPLDPVTVTALAETAPPAGAQPRRIQPAGAQPALIAKQSPRPATTSATAPATHKATGLSGGDGGLAGIPSMEALTHSDFVKSMMSGLDKYRAGAVKSGMRPAQVGISR